MVTTRNTYVKVRINANYINVSALGAMHLPHTKTFKYMRCITMQTMATISLRVEDSFAEELEEVERSWQADRSEVVRRLLARSLQEWKVEHALEQLRARKISIGKAAAQCGLSLWEMLDIAKERTVDWADYSEGDIEKDLALLKKIKKKR